jgi:nitric oxide reductase large subunit
VSSPHAPRDCGNDEEDTMIGTLISVILLIIGLGVIIWAIQALLPLVPLPPPFHTVVNVLLTVLVVLVVLYVIAGLLGAVAPLRL